MTEFIDTQLSNQLRADEKILHRGYLQSVTSGSIISALRAKGYWVALTNERLLLIKTDVGVTKPLMRNKGVESIEHAEISAALMTRDRLDLTTVDNRKWSLIIAHKKKVPGSEALLKELHERWGTGEVAKELKRSGRIWRVLGGVVAIVGLIWGIYQCNQTEPRVSVQCMQRSSGIVDCNVKNMSDSKVEVCFTVALTCDDGERVTARQCSNVRGSGFEFVVVAPALFAPHECETATKLEVSDLSTKSP